MKESILLFLSGRNTSFSMEGIKRAFILGRRNFTPTHTFCRPLAEAFRMKGTSKLFLSNLVCLFPLHLAEKRWFSHSDSAAAQPNTSPAAPVNS